MGPSRPTGTSEARKRRWRRWVLVLVPVLLLVSAGVGAFAGYNYCVQEADNEALRDCAKDTVVNVYRTLWGNPDSYRPDKSTTGTVKTETFYSKALGQEMEYRIYLPPGYDDPRNNSVRYPVVYLLPGSSGSTKAWVNAGGMAEQMDSLLAQGQVRPMILVTPQETPSRFTFAPGYVDGPLGNWATYTTRDLVNEIDHKYRTVRSKDGRAIAGNSEGGYGAMNLGLKNPSEFGVIGSFSGYFTIDEDDISRIFGGDQDLAKANSPTIYLPQLEGTLPAIFLYVGQGEGRNLAENSRFANELKAYGTSFEFNTFPGTHSWDLWREHLPEFLIFASEHLTGEE